MKNSGLLLLMAMLLAIDVSRAADTAPLRKVEEVRGLSRAQASRRPPVALRGVVTMAFPNDRGGFILDDGFYGVFVKRPPEADSGGTTGGTLKVGMLLEVDGFTTEVGFARDVVAAGIRRMGTAPLPGARPTRMDDLLGGHLDCQRVTVSGVVQSWERRPSAPTVRLMLSTTGGRKLPVLLMNMPEERVPTFLDSEVEATGVATSFFNERGELIGANVQVHHVEALAILARPSAKEELPLLPLESLMPFSTAPPSPHRVKVRGTVSFAWPGEFFYVQEGERAVRVVARGGDTVSPGDRVEILGYPEMRSYFAEITGAEVAKIGTAEIPPAARTARARILRRWQPAETPGSLDGRRVEIEARLDKIEATGEGIRRLFLTHEDMTVVATVLAAGDGAPLPAPGSRVRVTGACVVELNTSWPGVDWAVPRNFHLLVQSPAGITLVSNAPWWTPNRIWTALAVAAASAGAATAWVIVLGRQVRAQTETIRMQSVRETLAEERSRLAREFHDTLEQELTGIAIQLDAAADSLPGHPDHAVLALESAHTLLNYTRTEARRSIWDLRAMALQNHGLLGALRWTADQLHRPGAPAIDFECAGQPRRLDARTEANLLRIGSECLTNAVKHSRAGKIGVTLEFTTTHVRLSVRDDGTGFRVPEKTGLADGHFGFHGMRERAHQIGATFQVESQPDHGTRITVTAAIQPGTTTS